MENLKKEDINALNLIDMVTVKYIEKKLKELESGTEVKNDSDTFKEVLYNILVDSHTKNVDVVGYTTSLTIFAELKNYDCMKKILDSKDPTVASKLLYDIYLKDIFEKEVYQMKYQSEIRQLEDTEFKRLLEPFTFVLHFINQYNPDKRKDVIKRAVFFSMYKPEIASDFLDEYANHMLGMYKISELDNANMIDVMNKSAEQEPEEFNKISIMALEKSKSDILKSDNKELKKIINYLDYDIQFLKDNPTKYMIVPSNDIDNDDEFKRRCTEYMMKTENLTFWNQVYNKGYAIFY